MSPAILTPTPLGMGAGDLILSDGLREIDLVGDPFAWSGIHLVDFKPPIAQNENTMATSPDMEGASRTRRKPNNATGSGLIRVVGDDGDTLWNNVDNLEDLFAQANANKGTLRYTPPSGTAVTFDLESLEFPEMPHDLTIQWKYVEFPFTFECRPYGRLDPVTLIVARTITGPIDSVELPNVEGHVPAWGEMTLTDETGQVRDDVEWGIAEDYADTDPIRIEANDLETVDFSGSLGVGQIDGNTQDDWIALCGLGAQSFYGRYRVKVWAQFETTDIQMRLSWQRGSEPLGSNYENSTVAHLADTIIEVDLGTINVNGDWSGQIEVMADTVGLDVAIIAVQFIPAKLYGRARAPSATISRAPQMMEAEDTFGQPSGPLDGLTSDSGDPWNTFGGGPTDFEVSDVLHVLTRTEDSESFGQGRYAVLGPSAAAQGARVTVQWQRILDDDATLELTTGVILRCDGTDDNWLMMGLSAGRETGTLFIAKRVGGAAPEIIEPIDYSPYLAGHDVPYRIVANVNTDGTYTMYIGKTKVLDGFDPDLQAGQPLEEGQAGIFDGYAGAGFPTVGRVYSNFATWVPPVDHVVYPNEALSITNEAALRDNGNGFGRVPRYDGDRLLIPPATRADRSSRLVIKQDRNDLVNFPVGDQGDELTLGLNYTPRVLLTTKN